MRATWQMTSILLILAFPLSAQSNPDADVTLICQTQAQDASVHEFSLVVDYEKQTVNGKPAHITNSSIRWASRSDSYYLEWDISRYTGQARVSVRDGPADSAPTYHSGRCDRVTERKF